MTVTTIVRRKSKVGNKKVEARLQRVRDIPNLRFQRFEDYRQMAGGWGYSTRADGAECCGDFKDADCPASADDYVSALCADETESGEIYFEVPYSSGSDYSGSTVHRANYLWFKESYGSKKWVHTVYGGYSTYGVSVGLTGLLLCNDSTFDAVCEALEGLDGYPVFDDESVSSLESANSDVAWDSWAAGDFRRAVEAKFAGHADFDWPADCELRTFFEERAEKANCNWWNEGGDDSMYIDLARIVKGIDLADLADYTACYEVSYNDCGERREDYSSEEEAAARVEELRANGFGGAIIV